MATDDDVDSWVTKSMPGDCGQHQCLETIVTDMGKRDSTLADRLRLVFLLRGGTSSHAGSRAGRRQAHGAMVSNRLNRLGAEGA